LNRYIGTSARVLILLLMVRLPLELSTKDALAMPFYQLSTNLNNPSLTELRYAPPRLIVNALHRYNGGSISQL